MSAWYKLGSYRHQVSGQRSGLNGGSGMKRVLVTGGSGKAGRACVRELLEHGYEVINVDVAPRMRLSVPSLRPT